MLATYQVRFYLHSSNVFTDSLSITLRILKQLLLSSLSLILIKIDFSLLRYCIKVFKNYDFGLGVDTTVLTFCSQTFLIHWATPHPRSMTFVFVLWRPDLHLFLVTDIDINFDTIPCQSMLILPAATHKITDHSFGNLASFCPFALSSNIISMSIGYLAGAVGLCFPGASFYMRQYYDCFVHQT